MREVGRDAGNRTEPEKEAEAPLFPDRRLSRSPHTRNSTLMSPSQQTWAGTGTSLQSFLTLQATGFSSDAGRDWGQEEKGIPLGLALGSPIFPSGCDGKLGVALESPQGRRDLT